MPDPISKRFQQQSTQFFLDDLEEKNAKAIHKRLCMFTTSTSAANTYEWIGGMPGVNEFLDQRYVKSLKKFDYTIKNRKWESTLGFDNDELDDAPAVVKERIPTLSEAAAEHPQELLLELMAAGEVELCYDKLPFFHAAHPSYKDGITFSNIVTQSGTTDDNIKEDFDNIVLAAISLKKTNGHSLFPIGSLEWVIIHPTTLNAKMDNVFNKQYISGSASPNDYFQKAEHFPAAFLTGTSWYAFIVNKAIKPFVFQQRKKMNAQWDFSEKFGKDKSFFGVDGRYNAGLGIPQLAFKSKG